jgi:hypothetical protein
LKTGLSNNAHSSNRQVAQNAIRVVKQGSAPKRRVLGLPGAKSRYVGCPTDPSKLAYVDCGFYPQDSNAGTRWRERGGHEQEAGMD